MSNKNRRGPLPEDTEVVDEDAPEDIGLGAPVAGGDPVSVATAPKGPLTAEELAAVPKRPLTRDEFLAKWPIPPGGWLPRQFQTQAEKAEMARRPPQGHGRLV
jgi:hypothetical protein